MYQYMLVLCAIVFSTETNNPTTTAPSREITATITPSETTTATSSDTTAASITNSETTVRVTAAISRPTATSYETTVTGTPRVNSTLTDPPIANYCQPSSNNETIVTILYATPAAGNSFIIDNTGICIDSVSSIVTYVWPQNSVCICQYAIGSITCFFVKK